MSINFDDTNKLLLDIQRILVSESRKEKIEKILKANVAETKQKKGGKSKGKDG